MILETLTYNLFMSVFGNPLIIGVFIMLMIYIMGLAFRLSGEMQIIMMFISTVTIVYIFIPQIVGYMLVGTGIFIGIFLFYRILGK